MTPPIQLKTQLHKDSPEFKRKLTKDEEATIIDKVTKVENPSFQEDKEKLNKEIPKSEHIYYHDLQLVKPIY